MLMRRRKRQFVEIISSSDDIEAAPRPLRADERPGSITQQLDMNESGPLRGDEILHHHGLPDPAGRPDGDPMPLAADRMEHNYQVNMSEEGREGDEESGDEHSSGLQGGENNGLPGDMTEKVAKLDPSLRGYRKRAS